MNIYVGNLPREASEDDLVKAFQAFGQVDKVSIIIDRMTGESRGFGFVEMPNAEEAQTAIAGLNGKEMMGRTLAVNEARPRSEGRDNRGHRGGGGERPRGGGGGGYRPRGGGGGRRSY